MQFHFDTAQLVDYLIHPKSKIHWMYVASALLMAVAVHFWRKAERSDTSLVKFLFPRSVWLHRSALTDYLFVAVTMPLWALLIAPFVLSDETIAHEIVAAFTAVRGEWVAQSPDLGVTVAYTATLLLVGDLARYWSHRWCHRYPWLWEFHKVHHSAEVLTPITLYRVHPVEQIVVALTDAVMIGVVTGFFIYMFPSGLTTVTILGVNAGLFLFNIFGVNLRHSHIWLSFGRKVEHFILSPAQHQIHHSNDPKHFDRNFGFEFAFWDWMFDSLYVTTSQPEVLTYGLGEEENRKLSTVPQMHLRPFVAAARQLFGRKTQQEASAET
jgi:sterol desaturase/sphingolipid hydroxylase (fatty acid hydroxylase superfamily)